MGSLLDASKKHVSPSKIEAILEWKDGKRFKQTGLKKQADVTILMCNKMNFKPNIIRIDKEGHFIPTKGTIHQDQFTTLNIYAQAYPIS